MSGLKNKGYPPGFAAGIPLGDFPLWRPYVRTLTHLPTIFAFLPFFGTILKDFFFLQFSVKWKWRRIPVVKVDHPLDDLVPFRPELAALYIDFINFWIRALSMMLTHLGTKRALPHVARFFRLLTIAYKEAARMYRFCMSTTARPPCEDKLIGKIRSLDPHLLCVPSLHVVIVVLTFAFYRDLFRTSATEFHAAGVPPADLAGYESELRLGAVSIIETVLYVKQHSVNCIPAALYMLCRVFSDLVTIADAVSVINSLFVNASDVSVSGQGEIAAHINFQFERLLLEGYYSDDWTDPVRRWLLSYSR
jgi:hypothetical protein